MQLLQHENVDNIFANNVLAILLQMKAFSIGSYKNGPKATKSGVVRRIAMGRGTFLGSVLVAWHLSCSAQQQEHQSQPARNVRRAPNA